VFGVKYPLAWSALTSNGVSLTVSPSVTGTWVVSTGIGGWFAGGVWSGGGGVEFAVWPQSVAGMSAAASSAANAGRNAAESLMQDTRSRFIGDLCLLGWD